LNRSRHTRVHLETGTGGYRLWLFFHALEHNRDGQMGFSVRKGSLRLNLYFSFLPTL
jgi:hypothetical protein